MGTYVIAYDVGTTGLKTCLFEIDKTIKPVTNAYGSYNLYMVENGGAEQDGDEWWEAMCTTTKEIFTKTDVTPDQIAGISFCSQMQALVLVDKEGNAVRRPMSYMDQRAKEELKKYMAYGIQIAGANIIPLLKSIAVTGAVSCSVKDPVYKYKWVENHEPDVFARAYKWLDVKDYLICRCTDEFKMTRDSAFATLLYDTRKGKEGWSKSIANIFKVNMNHLPEIIESTDVAGTVTAKAAAELGLKEGTPVFGGGGDASLIGVGAGSGAVGDTHIYSGTSGWVGTVVDKQLVDTSAMIAAIVGADPDSFNYFAEMETAGKCLEWVRDHLCLDEIGMFIEKKNITEGKEAEYTSLYDYMSEVIDKVPAGANGVIFTPWLHGNRCPFEDPNAAGMFFNINIDTGKSEMLRAVIEGVCFHQRWMLEAEAKKVKTSDVIRFVGGGALSKVTCQILADVTGRTIETVNRPQDVGSVGAAAIMGIGLGVIENIGKVKDYVPAVKSYKPNPANKAIYDRNFEVFKTLYKNNKESFKALNG
ncbi:MAG: FGGY-family carbohydrate kinase [Clostridia bacterium]|nr:FGGY-family carbohydrate kinase [Clostridia bacterium]